jgi:imidazoleglycerol phosphate synthase glutamine amidotransferase subunit HisH|tara:strand:- start:592 stop:888 length:297 start_codon:yes stop_codon:yes gene_type:complete
LLVVVPLNNVGTQKTIRIINSINMGWEDNKIKRKELVKSGLLEQNVVYFSYKFNTLPLANKLVDEFHQLRYDDEDFANQYDADEFEEWLKDNELIEIN